MAEEERNGRREEKVEGEKGEKGEKKKDKIRFKLSLLLLILFLSSFFSPTFL